MKIGIITYHRAINYGSILQAYALNRYLRLASNKLDVETIDYRNDAQNKMYSFFQPWSRGFMNILRNFHSLIYWKSLRLKNEKFLNFVYSEIPLSKFTGSNTHTLRNFAKKYDKVIAGSDQIWNLRCGEFDENYMLSFVENSDKIAYAPSLGVSNFNSHESLLFRKYLESFSFLSVREQSASLFLSNLLKRDIQIVCDPVLLLTQEEWSILEQKSSFTIRKKYILCYFIGNIAGMRKFARKVQKETGLQVIIIMKNLRDIFSPFSTYFSAGPYDFIKLVHNAEYIITDSFHAVVFSHIFKKKFWVFANEGKSERLDNLLSISGLLERKLDCRSAENIDYTKVPDYSKNEKSINDYIFASKLYLSDILSLD